MFGLGASTAFILSIVMLLGFATLSYEDSKGHKPFCTDRFGGYEFVRFVSNTLSLPRLSSFGIPFTARYIRTIGNTIAFFMYKPTRRSENPRYSNKDVTFIVTTVDPNRYSFARTLSNILINRPAKVLVALAGNDIGWQPLADFVRLGGPPNKRWQMMAALTKVKTPLVAFVDDRVYVPPTWLEYMLPPLDDSEAGVVTPPVITTRFDHGRFSWAGFWNFIGCLYILRRNFDRQAINSVDGGISTVPGRAFLIRTKIMKDPDYVNTFLNEYMYFPLVGRIGPVVAGEDTFTTRWLYRHNWKIKVQQCLETTVETDNLGVYPRFKDQLTRWSRSSIRSRVTQMSEGWPYLKKYPWTFYAVNIQCLTNFPLLVDSYLLISLCTGILAQGPDFFVSTSTAVTLFLFWLLGTKMIKLIPHFKMHPWDLLYFPFYVLFVYYYTFHRLHALVTMGNDTWAGRQNLNDFCQEENRRHATIWYENGKFHDAQSARHEDHDLREGDRTASDISLAMEKALDTEMG